MTEIKSVDVIPRPLSARYESDFAYPTVKDRMPIILTKVVDTVYRMKEKVGEEIGKEGLEDLKDIVGLLSKLKNELQTNKPLTDLPHDGMADVVLWNKFIESDRKLQESEGLKSSWFISAWLLTECYFYRRIMSAIRLSKHLNLLDPFGSQKKDAFLQSLPAVSALASHFTSKDTDQPLSEFYSEKTFSEFFHVSLWGNRCDLSISAGARNHQTNIDPIGQLSVLQSSVLRDDTSSIWTHLQTIKKPGLIDYVLDNAGFELFTDLCLAEFLVASGIATRVRFHGKVLPWFVSDVTATDWNWTLDEMSLSDSKSSVTANVEELGRRWRARLEDGSWQFTSHVFWTLPCDFTEMSVVAPDLHADLATASLVIFKGDLNYRKLIGDLHWPSTVTFETALRGFCPAPLCCLRTLKCDVVVGLEPGQAEATQAKNSDWMLSGAYAVIQFITPSPAAVTDRQK